MAKCEQHWLHQPATASSIARSLPGAAWFTSTRSRPRPDQSGDGATFQSCIQETSSLNLYASLNEAKGTHLPLLADTMRWKGTCLYAASAVFSSTSITSIVNTQGTPARPIRFCILYKRSALSGTEAPCYFQLAGSNKLGNSLLMK